MIIGFSRHFGLGGSGPVLDYLTGYLVNGEARDPKPEVVRGDAKAVAKLIDSLPFKRRYTSGVLSFAAEDNVTPEIQEDIMNRFESAAFAGISPDRRSIVWVKHRDKGRTELHFVVPRIDLGTGKSLNIAANPGKSPFVRHIAFGNKYALRVSRSDRSGMHYRRLACCSPTCNPFAVATAPRNSSNGAMGLASKACRCTPTATLGRNGQRRAAIRFQPPGGAAALGAS